MLFGGRKIYFIKKNLQSRFILRFVAAAAVWAAISVMLFAYLAGKKLDDLRYSSNIDIETTSELLLPITVSVHAVSLLIFAGILAYTIRSLWQRLSPPLAAIKKSIAKIADGDLTNKIVLRKKDEFRDMARELEGMRIGLWERIDLIKERQQELSAAADAFHASLEGGDPLLSHAEALQSAVGRMKESLGAFYYR